MNRYFVLTLPLISLTACATTPPPVQIPSSIVVCPANKVAEESVKLPSRQFAPLRFEYRFSWDFNNQFTAFVKGPAPYYEMERKGQMSDLTNCMPFRAENPEPDITHNACDLHLTLEEFDFTFRVEVRTDASDGERHSYVMGLKGSPSLPQPWLAEPRTSRFGSSEESYGDLRSVSGVLVVKRTKP